MAVMHATAVKIEDAEDGVAMAVMEALRAAGLLAQPRRPELRVVTGDGERVPHRDRVPQASAITVVVVMADSLESTQPVPATDALELQRAGDRWAVSYGGRAFSVRHSVGMAQLVTLLRNPGHEIEAPALAGRPREDALTIDPLIDPSARAAYRAHVDDLRAEICEAERDGDRGRVEQLRAELRFIAEHLADATGLAGRDRNWTSEDERARVAVTKAVRRAIAAIAAEDEALGAKIDASVETGRVCVFKPLLEVRVVG